MLEWTGERYLPFVDSKIVGAEIHYEHLHRYAFAAQFVEGKDVLDLASGEGYGSNILSIKANHVVGIDLDQNVIAHARDKYKRRNLEFKQGTILEIPIMGTDVFDVIICFEAVEHIEDHNKLLLEVKRLLKDSGIFIISTPNKKAYSDVPEYKNQFHISELYFDEFKKLISDYFQHIYLFGQRVYSGSNIWPIKPKEYSCLSEFVVGYDDEEMHLEDDDEKIPLYFIAIASNSALSSNYLAKSSLIDIENTLIGLRDARIAELGESIKEAVERTRYLDAIASSRDGRIEALNQMVSERDKRIQALNQMVSERDRKIQALNQMVLVQDKRIEILIEQAYKLEIRCRQLEGEIINMQNSVVWQFTMKYHNIFVENGLPQGTRRRDMYDLGIKGLRIIINDGLGTFWERFKSYYLEKRIEKNTKFTSVEDNSGDAQGKIFSILEERCRQIDQSGIYSIDVIVPIYNAYEDLIKCIYSLLNHQDIYRIILVNDCSSDPRIGELLKDMNAFGCFCLKIMENNSNLGFVRTVNIGLKESKSDVILLNSDTIVTSNWARKIRNCAYSDKEIATVTPFTNNGTICSIPEFLKDNDIPEGFTIDTFSKFIDIISLRRYPEIPTAVGFCMYIKREIINEVGYFDEEAFGKGYGEENDFCMRAIKQGYKNVLCDDTFIYHKGGSSFLDIRDIYTREHLKILSEKHPEYLTIVESFIRSNPLSEIQENINSNLRNMLSIDEKLRILFVLHDWGGGTEKHVLDMASHLSYIYAIYIIEPSKEGFEVEEYSNCVRKIYKFDCEYKWRISIFSSHEYRSTFKKIVDMFRINIIHIHHLIGHTFDILDVADDLDIPITFTVHDFYSICPRINLLDNNLSYCQEINDYNRCAKCLSSIGLDHKFVSEWRHKFKELFDRCRIVVAPSRSAFEILNTCYEIDESKQITIEHGYERSFFEHGKKVINNSEAKNLEDINIAFIGALGPHKGEEIFYELAQSGYKKKINWFIIGISSKLPKPGNYPKYNVYVTGKYRDEQELFRIIEINNIHIAVFPSPWPETYSYTLSECWIAGIPPIVSDLGALKERVEKTKAGWIVSPDAISFKRKIDEIIHDFCIYNNIKSNIINIKFRSIEEMCGDYSKIYEGLVLENLTEKSRHQFD